MQFSKYLLAFVLSSVLAEATEHPSLSTRKETPSQQISTKSATIHYYEAPKPTLKDEDYEYDHEEEEHNRTTTTHEATKTHYEQTKVTHTTSLHSTHTTSLHSTHMNTMSHNSTSVAKSSMMHLITSTATSTAMASMSHISEASVMSIHSEASFMAVDTTMAESISTEMTFNVFTMSLSASYVSNTVMATLPSASKSAPSAGFATTSRAVFTGSAGRQSVDYLLVAAFSALASMAVWA